jgi:hypothetical protein
MIRLKEDPENIYRCPECHAGNPHIHEFVFESVNIFARCTCNRCDFKFVQLLPVGHCVNYSLSIGLGNKKLYKSNDCPVWLSDSVIKSHEEIRSDSVSIEKIVYKTYDQVVILNTLDSLYGHVLLKLYNAIHHLDHDEHVGLVLIIPRIFKWLIPAGCAEVWIVDVKLSSLIYGYEDLQKFVADQLVRFKVVYLSKAYSHPGISSLDIERFTGVIPFNMNNYTTQTPVITFVLRDDRWWFTNTMDYWFYRICRRLKVLSSGARILTIRQNHLVKRTIKAISRRLPDAKFYITGLGMSTGNVLASDQRKVTISAEVESEWCRIYAMSHIVIGIHGSNMLLPTAHAAGCIEILPEDRYGNMIQDITVRHHAREQLYFYRFSDQFSKPKSIATKAIAMINDYRIFRKNMVLNTYDDYS